MSGSGLRSSRLYSNSRPSSSLPLIARRCISWPPMGLTVIGPIELMSSFLHQIVVADETPEALRDGIGHAKDEVQLVLPLLAHAAARRPEALAAHRTHLR